MNVSEKDGKFKEKRERRNFLKLLDDIKTGKVLILISSCYILLTLPHTIDQFMYVVIPGDYARKGDAYEIFTGNCYLLLTCNYSLNFYFYCMINQDIRKKTIALFSRKIK